MSLISSPRAAAKDHRYFTPEEYQERLERVRKRMAERRLDACLISSPENVYYLSGLDHQGYFAFSVLLLPVEGQPILITRAMEQAIVRDQVPDYRHVGYSDGVEALPAPAERERDLLYGRQNPSGDVVGLQPWSTSLGVPTAGESKEAPSVSGAVRVTTRTLQEAGLGSARLGIEKQSSFLPYRIAEGIVTSLGEAHWEDCSGMVDECRLIQSPRELTCTRQAAALSDAMMEAAIATAGAGVNNCDVVAAIYDVMVRRGGTYPGFVPLVRSTTTLDHEHGTWQDQRLARGEALFLELAGCVRRYHAPTGRLVYIGGPEPEAREIQRICREAIDRAEEAIFPGALAGDVYRAWQSRLDESGLSGYRRHHCGYSIGIGYPPSWSGSGVPVGLRQDSTLELRPGMVFHLMSWLLRTGRGDSFFSDTVVVTETGCERITAAPRELTIR